MHVSAFTAYSRHKGWPEGFHDICAVPARGEGGRAIWMGCLQSKIRHDTTTAAVEILLYFFILYYIICVRSMVGGGAGVGLFVFHGAILVLT